MDEKTQDVLNVLADDSPENRQIFEEKYGSFFMNVLTGALIGSFELSSKFKGNRRELIRLIGSYQNPSTIEPLKRAFKRDAKGHTKIAIMQAICQFDDLKATQFLISLLGSEKDDEKAKDCFKQYPFHMEMLKTLKPDLVDTVLLTTASEKKQLKCYKCGRTEDKVKLMTCPMCGRGICVDHNYYNGYCSITCAK